VITVSKDSSGCKDFIREVTKKYKPKEIIKPKGNPKKMKKKINRTVRSIFLLTNMGTIGIVYSKTLA